MVLRGHFEIDKRNLTSVLRFRITIESTKINADVMEICLRSYYGRYLVDAPPLSIGLAADDGSFDSNEKPEITNAEVVAPIRPNTGSIVITALIQDSLLAVG